MSGVLTLEGAVKDRDEEGYEVKACKDFVRPPGIRASRCTFGPGLHHRTLSCCCRIKRESIMPRFAAVPS